MSDSRENHPRPMDTNALGTKSAPATAAAWTTRACEQCLRRSRLLAMLSGPLTCVAHDRGRLIDLLALGDLELIEALGGRRRRQLRERHARLEPREIRSSARVQTICRHHPSYPRGLKLAGDRAPRMLYMAGDALRPGDPGSEPIVAIVGSRRATDYGMEIARGMARGLAASGVTVAGSLSDGITVAAQAGALEANGRTLTVTDGGLDVACPARWRALYRRLLKTGCAVAELPCDCRTRQWCETARERIVVGLAELTIVVEADETPAELLSARVARTLGRTVAAVPGRVTSPASRGTHALLMQGAPLVRGPGDVLELLYRGNPAGRPDVVQPSTAHQPGPAELDPRLRTTLEQVGAGRDTPDKLTAAGEDAGEVLLALSELELTGLLTRGDGGRYVPRESLTGR
jgi:DNA processing protein